MESGIYEGISNEAYHADKSAISNTGLGQILRCPRVYWAWNLDPDRPPEPERRGQLEGTLAHCAVFEPDELEARFSATPENAPRRPTDRQRNAKAPSPETLDAIAWWDRWEAENQGREILPIEKIRVAQAQAASVREITDLHEPLANGRAEVSAWWQDPETGVMCRCRPDLAWKSQAGWILFDLKTYASANPRSWPRQVVRKGYHRQAAFYSDGWAQATGETVKAFVHLVVESEHPYAAAAIMLDEPAIELGRDLYRAALDRYAKCLENDAWPMYSERIEIVGLPQYAYYEIDTED